MRHTIVASSILVLLLLLVFHVDGLASTKIVRESGNPRGKQQNESKNQQNKQIAILSKALGVLYQQGGTLGVMERSEGMENYSGASLVSAAVTASHGNKGAASGIVNALLGSCCQSRANGTEKALELMHAYDALDDSILQPNLVALCLAYTAVATTHPNEAKLFLKRAENVFATNTEKKSFSERSEADWLKLATVHDIQLLQETDDFVVISKPSGMVCYHTLDTTQQKTASKRRRSGPAADDTSLEACLLQNGVSLSTLNKEGRGMVHRIDRGTSGCMVLAKTNRMHAILISEFFCRNVNKSYQALVCTRGNNLSSKGTIKLDVEGRPAMSSYEIETTLQQRNFCRIRVHTKQGRRHQVRIHCAQGLNSPILLDPLYNGQVAMKHLLNNEHLKESLPRLRAAQRFCLHADTLCLPNQNINVQAPLPGWWLKLEEYLNNMTSK